MIKILDFNKNHIDEAKKIALLNYNEEKTNVACLPEIDEIPNLEYFADNGLGVAAFNDDGMIGFLCCFEPWNNAFNSTAKGTFSPIHANGAILENRGEIYKRMYQAAAEKWVNHGINYHSIGLYAHDLQALNAFFTYGFGLRCIDAVRPLDNFETMPYDGIVFGELAKTDIARIRELKKMQSDHMGESPCFMRSSPKDFQDSFKRAETRNSRLFIATQADKLIAYMEVKDNGENYITEVGSMKNICGAFCLPEFRGKGIAQRLLNYLISQLKTEGYSSLGVDFESFNPTARGFWLKYFTAYTNSVVRRIDECILQDE